MLTKAAARCHRLQGLESCERELVGEYLARRPALSRARLRLGIAARALLPGQSAGRER